jgi:hypothetical protein
LVFAASASAQSAGGYSAGPGLAPAQPATPPAEAPPAPQQPQPPATASTPELETVVRASPEWTQDRTFPGTRFWKLDPGEKEFEVWWRTRAPRHSDTYYMMQLEFEVGISPRVQIDFYENLSTEETGELKHDGNQIEARIAIDPVYGRTPLNPVIYLEWQPRHLHGDRAEVRLLGGGGMLGPKLIGAVNLFYEQNLTSEPTGFVPNPEFGVTGGSSYSIVGQRLRAGAEMKLAFEKEFWGDARWEKQLLLGPNLSARIIDPYLKLYATCLFGVTEDAKKVDAFLILASGF